PRPTMPHQLAPLKAFTYAGRVGSNDGAAAAWSGTGRRCPTLNGLTRRLGTGSNPRHVPGWPSWPPRFRPVAGAVRRSGARGGSVDGEREESDEFWPAGLPARGCARGGLHSPHAERHSLAGASPPAPAARGQEPPVSAVGRAPVAETSRSHRCCSVFQAAWQARGRALSRVGLNAYVLSISLTPVNNPG